MGNIDGDRKANYGDAQTIRDEGLVGTIVIPII
jgi:hypothetical protein